MSSYLGNQPSNNFVSLKRQDITGDGTASYTLDHSVASVNDVLIYVNHVKQDPSSYTISGTSLTMGGTVSSSDDFYIIYLGQGLQTVTPADNTITTAMLQDTSVTSAKLSGVTQGITGADQFILTADITADQDPISSNLSRQDATGFGKVGTGMTQSSGVFTFPETGIWSIKVSFTGEAIANDNVILYTQVTTDNSTYTDVVYGASSGDGSSTGFMTAATEYLFDVTNTSTHKVRFKAQSITSGSKIKGQDTGVTFTSFTFIRLGDT